MPPGPDLSPATPSEASSCLQRGGRDQPGCGRKQWIALEGGAARNLGRRAICVPGVLTRQSNGNLRGDTEPSYLLPPVRGEPPIGSLGTQQHGCLRPPGWPRLGPHAHCSLRSPPTLPGASARFPLPFLGADCPPGLSRLLVARLSPGAIKSVSWERDIRV